MTATRTTTPRPRGAPRPRVAPPRDLAADETAIWVQLAARADPHRLRRETIDGFRLLVELTALRQRARTGRQEHADALRPRTLLRLASLEARLAGSLLTLMAAYGLLPGPHGLARVEYLEEAPRNRPPRRAAHGRAIGSVSSTATTQG